MKYRLLGRTGLFLSEIGLGCNMFGGQSDRWKVMGNLDQGAVDAVIGAAFEGGVNLLDTSNIYGEGDSERMIGKAIADLKIPREDIYISSKIGLRGGDRPNQAGLSRANLYASLEGSLKRLNTDYLDIYHVHCFDPLTPLEETIRALDDLVSLGKIRYIGCSNFAAWQIMKALGVSARSGYARFESVQACYTLAKRDIEREVVPLALDQQLSVLVWGPLMGGILTGKHSPAGSGLAGSRLASGANVWGDKARAFAAVEVMRPIAEAHGVPVAAVALAWLLQQPGVTSLIAGASKPEQLDANLKATELDLSAGDLEKLGAVAPLPPEYPMDLQNVLIRGRGVNGARA